MEKQKNKKIIHVYTEDEVHFLRQNAEGISAAELTRRFNEKYGLNVSQRSIEARKRRKGIKNYGLPIGTERTNDKGFVKIKTAQPNIWRLKHHIVYEKSYGEKIKCGEKIIFLDGNKRNFAIDNLVKIPRREQILLAKIGIKSNNPEITKAIINVAKIKVKILDIKKSDKGGKK